MENYTASNESPTQPLHFDRTELRLRLLDLGYEPIPNTFKACYLPDWSKLRITRELISSRNWARGRAKTTGLRCGKLAAIDVDIEDPDVRHEVLMLVDEIAGLSPFERWGKRPLYVYTAAESALGKQTTGKYVHPDTGQEYAVEILGKGSQFGAYGPHSEGIDYTWPEQDLLNGEAPPLIDAVQRAEIIERCAVLLQAKGLVAVSRQLAGEGYSWEYRLHGDDIFDVQGRGAMSVDEMETLVAGGGQLRVCMSALRPGADNPGSGQVSMLSGVFAICDHGDQVIYARALPESIPELTALGTLWGRDFPPHPPTVDQEPPPPLRDCAELTNVAALTDLPDLKQTARGAPAATQLLTLPNLRAVLDKLELRLRWNMLSRQPEAQGLACDYDRVAHLVVDELARVRITGGERCWQLLELLARQHPYHPMDEWLQGLRWDGTDRLDSLISSIDTDEALWPTYLARWLIQAVQAVRGWRDPQQVSAVLTLTGEQGIGKTSWLRSLVPAEWFNEGVHLDLLSYGAKDSIIRGLALPVAEIGELDATFRKTESAALKNFLSLPRDTYRAPYDRKTQTYPRTTTFCASVNLQEVLVDETGNRRYWPIRAESIQPHGLDLGQLWAQVNALWEAGERWWLTLDEDRARAREEPRYQAMSAEEERCEEVIRPRLGRKRGDWTPMNTTMVCRALELGAHPHPRTLGKVCRWLTLHVGQPGEHDGVRRSWLLPDLHGPLSDAERAGLSVVRD